MTTKITVPIISSAAIQVAIDAIDSEQHSLIYEHFWEPSTSEHLASLHVAKQQLCAYATDLREYFGAVYYPQSTHHLSIPIETDKFSTVVQEMLKEIYGQYLPTIEADCQNTGKE